MARRGGLFVDTSKAGKATKWSDQVQISPGRLTPSLPMAALGGPAVTQRRAASWQFLEAGQAVTVQTSGALTDRPRDTFRAAASQQLAGGGGQTHRTTYGGNPLHSPRNRDPGALFGEATAYKAPGSPRNQVEMFYIRHNKTGPKEVRLIARRDRAATFHQSPSFVNATLAQISPRSSFQDVAGGRACELVAVGRVTDWKTGWQKDGARLAGDGVKWSGRPRKKHGDYGTFTADAPVPLNSPLADNTSTLWQRGGAQRRKTPPTPDSADAEGMRSPAGSLAESVTLRSPIGNTKWPRQGGSPWKTFVTQVKKRSMTYEDRAEDTFGHAGAGMTQLHQLHRRNQLLTRIPRQWLHTKLTDININACQIQSLPSSFGDYAFNVTSLMLEHNLLSSLPDSIAKMSKLRFLGKLPLQLLNHVSCQLCTKTLVYAQLPWDCTYKFGAFGYLRAYCQSLRHVPRCYRQMHRTRGLLRTRGCSFPPQSSASRSRVNLIAGNQGWIQPCFSSINLPSPHMIVRDCAVPSDMRSVTVHRCSRCNATSYRQSRRRLATAENCAPCISPTTLSRSWRSRLAPSKISPFSATITLRP